MSFHRDDRGFSLIEVLVALLITMIVMSSVFLLLQKGQDSFRREPEVADMTASTRSGLDRIAQELALAGYKTPPPFAVTWADGGGITPDEITIVYADTQVPTSRPLQCGGGGGPCNTIDKSSTLNIDPETLDPPYPNPEDSYAEGMVLFAFETGDCNGDGQMGFIPFELTQPPKVTSAGGSSTLNLNHNPGKGSSELNPPGGFNGQVHPNCAVIGLFHVVQYRVNPLPPAENPTLERRDLSLGEPWTPVSANIENLQLQYSLGAADNPFADEPPGAPDPERPETWITRVRVTMTGRSESTNLQGATTGVFATEDTHLRKTFMTTMSLRNQLNSAQQKSMELVQSGMIPVDFYN